MRNLLREEAVARAPARGLVVRHRPGPDAEHDFGSTSSFGSPAASPGRRPSSSSTAAVWVTLNGELGTASTATASHSPICGRERAAGRALRLHPHRRGPAPLHRPGRRRDLPLRAGFLDDAQRVFACFDQPDLKAPVTLTVHRARRTGRSSATAGRPEPATACGRFATTPPISTYLFTLVAGPWHVAQHASTTASRSACAAGRRWPPHLDGATELLADHRAVLRPATSETVRRAVPVRDSYDQVFVPGVQLRARWRTRAASPSATSSSSASARDRGRPAAARAW